MPVTLSFTLLCVIRQVQLDGYYFAYKQSAWLNPGTLALIISCVPLARSVYVLV